MCVCVCPERLPTQIAALDWGLTRHLCIRYLSCFPLVVHFAPGWGCGRFFFLSLLHTDRATIFPQGLSGLGKSFIAPLRGTTGAPNGKGDGGGSRAVDFEKLLNGINHDWVSAIGAPSSGYRVQTPSRARIASSTSCRGV